MPIRPIRLSEGFTRKITWSKKERKTRRQSDRRDSLYEGFAVPLGYYSNSSVFANNSSILCARCGWRTVKVAAVNVLFRLFEITGPILGRNPRTIAFRAQWIRLCVLFSIIILSLNVPFWSMDTINPYESAGFHVWKQGFLFWLTLVFHCWRVSAAGRHQSRREFNDLSMSRGSLWKLTNKGREEQVGRASRLIQLIRLC